MTQSAQTNYVTINDEILSIVNDENLSKSSKIRTLSSMNLPRGQISKILNIRYQHVRNVLITPLKKNG